MYQSIGQQLAQEKFNRRWNRVALVILSLAFIGSFIRWYIYLGTLA